MLQENNLWIYKIKIKLTIYTIKYQIHKYKLKIY